MKPSEKSEGMEQALTKMFGFDRRDSITGGFCTGFGCLASGITENSFRDEISLKEYTISGLCQDCQDKVFGV